MSMIYNLPSLSYHQQTLPSSYVCPKWIISKIFVQVGRNICHGSDAVESANKEIALWFKPEELCSWESCQKDWVYE